MTSSIAQDLGSNEALPSTSRHDWSNAMQGVPTSDAQLISAARAREAGFEQRLYSRIAPIVNRLIWSLLGADAEKNDIAHEAFIRILRHIGQLQKPESLDTWAARITINTVRNELRKRRLRRWVFWNEFEGESSLQYVLDLDGRELLSRAYAVLDKLTPDERVIMSLRLFETGTLEELASFAGCSLGTAKRRLRKAKERFVRLARQDSLLAEWLDRGAACVLGHADE